METAHSVDPGRTRRTSDRVHPRQRIIAAPPAKTPARSSSGVITLIASAILAGFFLAPVIEILGAAAGLWHAPAHSEHTLDRTQRTVQALQSLAPVRSVMSIQQLLAVWQPVILQLLPFHPESAVSGYLTAAGNQLQTSLLRLAVLAALVPVAAAFLMLSIVEALLTRDKRRLRGGREHGFVYHRLQRVRTLTLWLPLFLFLLAPFTVPPVFLTLLVIPPAAYVWAHMVLFKRNV